MRRFAALFALPVFALALATAGSAETKVGGDLSIDVKTGHVVTVANGLLSKAETNIGSIADGTEIGGDATIKVSTGHVVTVANGLLSSAKTNIGTVGFSR
jgi:hypothetical protein